MMTTERMLDLVDKHIAKITSDEKLYLNNRLKELTSCGAETWSHELYDTLDSIRYFAATTEDCTCSQLFEYAAWVLDQLQTHYDYLKDKEEKLSKNSYFRQDLANRLAALLYYKAFIYELCNLYSKNKF